MARFSVTPVSAVARGQKSRWLTTMDAARMLQLTRWGVWWLARQRDLEVERTASGQLLFHRKAVEELVLKRAEARLRRRPEVLRGLRLVHNNVEPQQLVLPLAAAAGRRKVAPRVLSEAAAVPREIGVSPISAATLPAAADRKRMAKVEVDGGRIRRAVARDGR